MKTDVFSHSKSFPIALGTKLFYKGHPVIHTNLSFRDIIQSAFQQLSF